MSSLTKVSVRDGKEWVKIDADSAIAYYPQGASAKSRQFRCDICGQYVIFAVGSINRPYFKHNSSEESKDCEERTFSPYVYTGKSYSPKERIERHSLPLRIVINGNNLTFELGFPNLFRKELKNICNGGYVAVECTKTIYNKPFNYGVSERFNSNKITYLPVGNEPAEEYIIKLNVKN